MAEIIPFRPIEGEAEQLGPELAAILRLPPREASYAEPATPLHPMLESALLDQGIERLYSHQATAFDAILAGQDTLIVSPTASGKTLCYNLPVLHSILSGQRSRALYLFPLKALAQDQLRGLRELTDCLFPRVEAAIYDGDTPDSERKRLWQRPPDVLITNPDMLHYGLLPYHTRKWQDFFDQLRFIVIDEVHTYRGVFGAHMAHLLRRLLRVARQHGASPSFVLSSGTIGNPAEVARALTGREARIIAEVGAPAPGSRLFVVNPITSSLHTMACKLTILCIRAGLKCITFTKARRITELISTWIEQQAPDLAGRVSAYRSGFLPEERREIEQRLFSGELDAVISTSALEVGIDVGGLDACILVGYPGSITTTFQRAGRVGRGDREGLIFLIAGEDALDQYFVRNPEQLLRRGFEPSIVDPRLGEILRSHLPSAAVEHPVSAADPEYAGLPVEAAAEELVREGQLQAVPSRGRKIYFAEDPHAHRKLDLRGGGDTFTIVQDSPQGLPGQERVVGSLSGFRAYAEGHEGAVYLHRGQSYLVTKLDVERRNIHVQPAEVAYYTQALFEKQTEILQAERSRPLGNIVARLGRVRVTTRIHSYQKRRVRGQDLLSTHPLELPRHVLETQGLWWEIDDGIAEALGVKGNWIMGALHATEHCAIGLMPLFALCDRLDLAGICFPRHPQTGKSTIFIYDGASGGSGLAARGWELSEELLRETRQAIERCPCEAGCPSCIQSPRCGAGNKPLDKPMSVELLALMLGERPLSNAKPPEPTQESLPEPIIEIEPKAPRIVVFDVETQRSADDVGGWHNAHLMRVAIAVAHDSKTGQMRVYREDEVDALIDLLEQADLVVGYNCIAFDYQVLRAYSATELAKLPTLDLFVDIKRLVGRRVGLGDMTQLNLGAPKTADGLQSLRWWKEGKIEPIIEYCKVDVDLTRRLFELGAREGKLKAPGGQFISVSWDADTLIRRTEGPS